MISDSSANFALRGASDAELGIALARCQQDFFWWYGQAITTARFPFDARAAGIELVLEQRNRDFLDFADSAAFLMSGPTVERLPNSVYAQRMVPQQLDGIEHSARVAAVVMLHSACERYFWRLIRLAMVRKRTAAVEQIAGRKISIRELTTEDRETLIDGQLEKWWENLDRASLLEKWDTLISLVGSPAKLRDGKWHFDRDMLAEFDMTRHECVHQTGITLKSYDFDEFAKPLERTQWVWSIELAKLLNVKIPAQIVFSMPDQTQ